MGKLEGKVALQNCVEAVISSWGRLDILGNNAQEVALGPLMSVSDEAFNAGWESGPLASFRLMKLCYPYLKGGGSIINLASTSAMRWDFAYYGVMQRPIAVTVQTVLPAIRIRVIPVIRVLPD